MPEDRLKGRDEQFIAVMESASRLQRLVPGAVLEGGSAAILYADHRESRDHDHVLLRNVDASPEEPVERWPLEAIQTALERRSLEHWHRIAAAIKAQPWGPVARDVEEILSYNRPYGVAKTMERIIERAREASEAAERAAVAAEVERLIKESGLSRRDFASRIGTSTSRLSTYATGKVVPSAALLLRMRSVASTG